MAVYYLGNPIEKRARLLGVKDAIYVDNDEVLAAYGKGRHYCFIVGKVAFGDFTVWEYLSYTKSLELKRPLKIEEARELITKTGFEVPLTRRLKRLDAASLKAVRLAALIRPDTTRICLNFDGVLYTRKNRRGIQRLIAGLSDYIVCISVSDIKLVPKEGTIKWCQADKAKPLKVRLIREGKRAVRL